MNNFFCYQYHKQYGLNIATRSLNSRLDKSKLVVTGFASLPTWQDAVSRYLKEADLYL